MSTELPMRSCAACRMRRPQGLLLRIVRKPDATVVVNFAKKRSPGRGAYICAEQPCLERAKQRRALQRALRCEINDEVFDKLAQLIAKSSCDEVLTSQG